MKIVAISFIVFIISSCASYSSMHEKEWLREKVNTNELNAETVSKNKAVFSGSVKNKYSNITENEVNEITLDFLNMLQSKYSEASIIFNNDEAAKVASYKISYEILNNSVKLRNHQSARSECYISSRNVTVKLDVENIKNETVIWSGVIDKELESSNCDDRSELNSDTFGGLLVEAFVSSVVEGAVDSVTGTYKTPPGTFDVASRAILGFYKTMP